MTARAGIVAALRRRIHALTSSRSEYTTGTTTRVSRVEVISPPITARAIGARISPPDPTPSASGSMPKIIAAVVMMMGRRRVRPAWMMAARRSRPRPRSTFVKSTSRMAFFVTRPISMMRPMSDMMLTVSPVRSSIVAIPTIERGSESMIDSGSTNDSNCAARMR